MWNGSILNPVGETTVKVKNEKTDKKYKMCFTIVNENLKPILGKHTSEMMNLIKINYDMSEPVCALKTSDIKQSLMMCSMKILPNSWQFPWYAKSLCG